ncbi:hypothetical protein [Nocardia tenerifensis]|uniref:hypothetical protein n=1 Tax=Nocardia tenerifensis TaxID=228006 RepID=UPI001B870A82|nr:hypothetical protein [Nocardia tenerifensis]
MRRHPVLSAALLPVIPSVIAGLVVLVPDKGWDVFSDKDSPATAQVKDGPTSTQESARPSSAPATSSNPGSNEVRWSGTVNLTYLDLDSLPPRVLSSNTGATTWVSYDYKASGGFEKATLYGLGGGFFTTKPTIALWNAPTTPTRQQCADLISTRGAETIPVDRANSYCVKTAANRVAYLTGLTLDNDLQAYTATVTVWAATQ